MADTHLAQEDQVLNRQLPANIQAEQMLLGSIMLNCDLLNQLNEFLRKEHFFEPLHQKIFNAVEFLVEKGLSATTISVTSMIDKEAAFAEVGGAEYLVKLTTMAMVVINPYDYGRIIYDLAIKRNLIQIGEDIVNEAYGSNFENSATDQLERAEDTLFRLASEGINERTFLPIKDSIQQSIDSINRAMKNTDHVSGISTGLIDLDNKLSGFHNSDLVIIAGRPSMGKTAFAINFALNACKALAARATEDSPQKSVAIFSLEMSSEQLSTRLLSMITKIDSTALRNGKINEEHYNDLRKAASDLSETPIFIDDTPALSISTLRARARKLKRKNNLGIIFIDYLQLLRGSTRVENRVLEISQITQGLKALAKELDVPVIALSQLSRAVEHREDKRPMLSDLRESGSIEQDADVVMFLFRKEYYLLRQEPDPGSTKHTQWQEDLNKVHDTCEILVAKHRNGAVGNVQVHYVDKYSTIGNLIK